MDICVYVSSSWCVVPADRLGGGPGDVLRRARFATNTTNIAVASTANVMVFLMNDKIRKSFFCSSSSSSSGGTRFAEKCAHLACITKYSWKLALENDDEFYG